MTSGKSKGLNEKSIHEQISFICIINFCNFQTTDPLQHRRLSYSRHIVDERDLIQQGIQRTNSPIKRSAGGDSRRHHHRRSRRVNIRWKIIINDCPPSLIVDITYFNMYHFLRVGKFLKNFHFNFFLDSPRLSRIPFDLIKILKLIVSTLLFDEYTHDDEKIYWKIRNAKNFSRRIFELYLLQLQWLLK